MLFAERRNPISFRCAGLALMDRIHQLFPHRCWAETIFGDISAAFDALLSGGKKPPFADGVLAERLT